MDGFVLCAICTCAIVLERQTAQTSMRVVCFAHSVVLVALPYKKEKEIYMQTSILRATNSFIISFSPIALLNEVKQWNDDKLIIWLGFFFVFVLLCYIFLSLSLVLFYSFTWISPEIQPIREWIVCVYLMWPNSENLERRKKKKRRIYNCKKYSNKMCHISVRWTFNLADVMLLDIFYSFKWFEADYSFVSNDHCRFPIRIKWLYFLIDVTRIQHSHQ